ncbi:HU family DNA-binding protein [Albirhodobacter sp. R86504]|jgi:DNA-binding protein HU-alpha|uniref:HU family DNA-binding protein n=1 Tax=Albirhodobacter sp. R86504 TaxID=3093848 RepID=UPI00366B8B04
MATTKKSTKSTTAAATAEPVVAAPQEIAAELPETPLATGAVTGETDDDINVMMRKKEFIERIVAESGAKRGDVRTISEAALKVLGDALSNGEAVNLPPLGRMRITRSIDKNDGEVLVIKLRRNTPNTDAEKTSPESLAQDDE